MLIPFAVNRKMYQAESELTAKFGQNPYRHALPPSCNQFINGFLIDFHGCISDSADWCIKWTDFGRDPLPSHGAYQ